MTIRRLNCTGDCVEYTRCEESACSAENPATKPLWAAGFSPELDEFSVRRYRFDCYRGVKGVGISFSVPFSRRVVTLGWSIRDRLIRSVKGSIVVWWCDITS